MACGCRKNLYDKWKKNEGTTRVVSLDYCAGAPVEPEVLKEYFNLARKYPGHTGSLHPTGLEAYAFFEKNWQGIQDHPWFARFRAMAFPSASAFFFFLDRIFPGRTLYCSCADHPSLVELFGGCGSHSVLKVLSDGTLDISDALGRVKEPAVLISFAVNHETGALQDWAGIAKAFSKKDVLLGVDAVQAPGRMDMKGATGEADFFVVSPYKFGGLKSLSFAAFGKKAWAASALKDDALFLPGPKDPALFGAQLKALSLWNPQTEKIAQSRMCVLENYFLKTLHEMEIPFTRNSPDKKGAGILNISFPFLSNMESFFESANDRGISVSRFSACTDEINGPSAVLLSCGVPESRACTSLRISAGAGTAEEDFRLLAKLLFDFSRKNPSKSGK